MSESLPPPDLPATGLGSEAEDPYTSPTGTYPPPAPTDAGTEFTHIHLPPPVGHESTAGGSSGASAGGEDRPEIAVGLAFAGGLATAIVLKRLAS